MRLPAIGTLALLACGPADPPAPAPRTPPVADAPEHPGIYPGQIVAVPDGVTVYAAPDASAAHVRLRFERPADARADGLVARTMVASAVHGEFVALSTAPDDADFLYGLCTDLVEDLERLETTLYVRRSELLPLVREALAIDHPDGTTVVLRPGVVVDHGAGVRPLLARGVQLWGEVPPRALADSLDVKALGLLEGELAPQAHVLADGASLQLGGRPVAGASRLYAERAVGADHHRPAVFAARDAGRLLTLRNRCLELTARSDLPAAEVDRGDPQGPTAARPDMRFAPPAGRLQNHGGFTREVVAYQLRRGAAFTALAGAVTGRVTVDTAFTSAPTREGDQLCFTAELGGLPQPEFRLCFESAQVRRLPVVLVTGTRAEGPLKPERLVDLAYSGWDDLLGCYERALGQRPALQADLELAFYVAPRGELLDVLVTGAPADDAGLGACVRAAARRWSPPFPEDPRAAVGRVDLRLRPG